MDSNEIQYQLAEAEKLVNSFNNCTLAKAEWTHEAHLIGGLWMLSHFGENALDEMRIRIKRFNESVGGVNDDQNGYHETLTVFWLWALKEMLSDEDGKLHWDQDSLDDLIFDETLADRNLWTEFYTKERMMSVEARRNYLAPDLNPMD